MNVIQNIQASFTGHSLCLCLWLVLQIWRCYILYTYSLSMKKRSGVLWNELQCDHALRIQIGIVQTTVVGRFQTASSCTRWETNEENNAFDIQLQQWGLHHFIFDVFHRWWGQERGFWAVQVVLMVIPVFILFMSTVSNQNYTQMYLAFIKLRFIGP